MVNTNTTTISFDKMEEEFAYSMGIQAYTFGLPLTICERERRIRLNPAAMQSMIGIAPVCIVNLSRKWNIIYREKIRQEKGSIFLFVFLFMGFNNFTVW